MEEDAPFPAEEGKDSPILSDRNDQKLSFLPSDEQETKKSITFSFPPRSDSVMSLGDSADLPSIVIRRPNSRIIPQLTEPGGPMLVQPNEPIMAKDPPEPVILYDENKSPFGLRCTCEDHHQKGTLVRCTQCGFYCHGQCVGVARDTTPSQFVCPFCQYHALRCPCGKNMKYDEPNIMCVICGYYSHKSCSKLLFGRSPSRFVCYYCGGGSYSLPLMCFPENQNTKNFTKTIDANPEDLVQKIPEGNLRNMIVEILGKKEIGYYETIQQLFNAFGSNAFDYGHEFWKTFVTSLANIFEVPKLTVIDSIDELVTSFLYKPRSKLKLQAIPGLTISDSILSNVLSESLTKLATLPTSSALAFTKWKSTCADEDLPDGAFICTIPGLLCHQDEIRAEDGIPLTCITLPGTPIAIDVSQSTNKFASFIRRSFHFNCVVKLQTVDGEPTVMLYATRTRGPMADERSTSGPAIPKGSELFLPFDTDLPYPVEKKAWKVKKAKPPSKPKTKPKPKPKEKTSEEQAPKEKPKPKPKQENHGMMKTRAKAECNVKLTLLSSFIEDVLPPLPFVIQEEAIDSGTRSIARSRHQSHLMKNESDQE